MHSEGEVQHERTYINREKRRGYDYRHKKRSVLNGSMQLEQVGIVSSNVPRAEGKLEQELNICRKVTYCSAVFLN